MAAKFFSDKDRSNIRWFWTHYMKDKLPWLIFVMVLIIIQGFVYQQFLAFTEKGLRVIFEDGAFWDLLKICGFVILAFSMRAAISYITPVLSVWLASDAVFKLRSHLISKVIHLRQSFFDTTNPGELILRLVNQVDGVSAFVGQTTLNALRDVVTIIIISGYLIYKSAILFVAAVVILPIIFFILKSVSEKIKKIQTASEKVVGAYMTSINEMSGGIRTIKMSNQEDTEISRMVEASAGIKDLSIKLQKAQALVLPGIDLSSAFVFVLVIGGGGYMVLSDDFQMDGASIITFILGMVIIFDPARGLSQFFAKLQASLILLDSIRVLMDTKGEKSNEDGKMAFAEDTVDISMNKISFSYLDGTDVFEDMSLQFKSGAKTAIVGSTGSGKTTILSLITRLYEISDGQIMFNGKDTREFTLGSIRNCFSVVAQDIVIFNKSIRDNIHYANPSASVEDVDQAARLARVDGLMHERGDIPVGPEGSQLSGGQKQRIAIARAFLSPAPVLILDEATSALDALTEKQVNDSFAELQKGKTTIVVTHKFASVIDADKIYVIESGKLVEEGTHLKFMARDSIYKSLFNAQLRDAK
ncbi:ABC transporter ATP-binding protein/permease [Paracoccaceae bacterium]|nr:ABC transporter ATP-binding protein/permease [Paracoccaceae bacterium]